MNIRRLFFTTLILFAHNVFAQVKKQNGSVTVAFGWGNNRGIVMCYLQMK